MIVESFFTRFWHFKFLTQSGYFGKSIASNQRGLLFFYAKCIIQFTTSIDGLLRCSDSVAKVVQLFPYDVSSH